MTSYVAICGLHFIVTDGDPAAVSLELIACSLLLVMLKRASTGEVSLSQPKRRKVTHETFKKWMRDLDSACQTMSWMTCETVTEGRQKVISKLKCKVCDKHKSKLNGRKHFSDRWIVGAESLKTNNIRDHASCEQHQEAMLLEKKEQARGRGELLTGPIVKALTTLSDGERQQLRAKFDIAYLGATEKIDFTKYPKICELEVKHGVQLGSSYLNMESGKTFTHYIAESKREELIRKIVKAKFFSILMDGSVDSANIDNELILAVWFDSECEDEKVHTRMSLLKVDRPDSVSADGLFDSLLNGLQRLGIQSISEADCSKLVGIGTDGASANVAAKGLKGLVEKELNWIFWMWCLAHRLELAVKDALKNTVFDEIEEMILRLYYLYENSPKKCRQLEEIISSLHEYIEFESGGTKPIRASGTRWIVHKINAMKRIISNYGAYTNHIASLKEDSTIKAADRAKLNGYYTKWSSAKYLLGCALFCDILTPCSIFSKSMQFDELDILGALSCLLKSLKETKKLMSMNLDQWPTYSSVLKKLAEDDGETNVYQEQKLSRLEQYKTFYSDKYKEYCSAVCVCIQSRLAWSDLQLFRDIITLLASQGWQKLLEEEEIFLSQSEADDSHENPYLAVERLLTSFKSPLMSAGADFDSILPEFKAMIEYAAQFFSLSTTDYRSIWWRLFHCPSASEWKNCLILV